ncbi:MAG: hypothetical protein DCC75_10745, partial [Proteobacteria bacterium]
MEISALAGLGLRTQEAKVYLALLELGATTIKPLAERSGVKRTSIYNFIDQMVQRGLVERSIVRGRARYSPADPKKVVSRRQQQLKELEQSLPALMALFAGSSGKPRISYFEGAAEVANILWEETRCRKETLYIWPGGQTLDAIGGAEVMNAIDKERIARKVWVRTVRFRTRDVRYAYSRAGEKYLRELRWAPPQVQVSMAMGIYDTGKVGFFSSRRESFGVLIESSELRELMTVLFRLLWASSSPA